MAPSEAFVRTRNATSARCYGFYSQLALIERHLWPTVLKSCIVGTTEDMDGFLETLGRVIRVPTSTHGKQLHVRPKYGMNPDIWAAFYQELTPLLREEIAFWKIATSVAQEQHRASRAFTKLISDADEEASRTCHARQGRVGWWVNPRPKRARTKVAVQAELTGARGTRRDREIFLRPYCSLQYRSYAKFLNLVSLTFTDFKNTHVTPHSWRAREAPRTT